MDEPENSKNNGSDALTNIRDAYTLATTPKRANEVDELIVKNFLNTLAEVALSIASSKARQ